MEGCLGRSGMTKLGSGPSGFHPALFLLSGDTCVVTGRLYGAALWSIWGWLVVAVRVNRPGLCGYVSAMLLEVNAAHYRQTRALACAYFFFLKKQHFVTLQYP